MHFGRQRTSAFRPRGPRALVQRLQRVVASMRFARNGDLGLGITLPMFPSKKLLLTVARREDGESVVRA